MGDKVTEAFVQTFLLPAMSEEHPKCYTNVQAST
jgi:hypothetical protein